MPAISDPARIAAHAVGRKLDIGSLGLTADDLLQEARLGIWKQRDILGKLDGTQKLRAEINVGKNAIVDHLRKVHGREPHMRDRRAALRISAGDDDDPSDHWTQDPQKIVEAMQAWESTAVLPTRLQILATLFGVGYSASEIADCIGISEGRVSQLRTQLGKILGAMT